MEKALSLAYKYLSFRARTIREVRDYLNKKAQKYAITPEEIESVIELLKSQGFLNDLEFVGSFVTSRNALKQKSRKVLTMELKKMGVTEADIDTYFEKNPSDETELAKKALSRKMKSLLLVSDEKKRFAKAISFLQRRGFSYDIAKSTYDTLNPPLT